MRRFVVPALTTMCLSGAFLAPAAAQAEIVTVEVIRSDLDLSSEAGKELLETRIVAAVKTACARPYIRDIKAMQAWESCKTNAFEQAREQLDESIPLAGL